MCTPAIAQHGAAYHPCLFFISLLADLSFLFSLALSPFSVPKIHFFGTFILNIHSYPHLCRLLLRSLLCLRTAELLLGGVLLRLLRLADGTDASNSIFAEICTVAVLSGLVCDALVDFAGGGIGAPGHGNRVLRGLLLVASFLGGHSNATVLGRLNTNGLVVCISSILERMFVLQVEGVTRKLDTTASLALNQIRALAAGDQPNEVIGNVGPFGSHFGDVFGDMRTVFQRESRRSQVVDEVYRRPVDSCVPRASR